MKIEICPSILSADFGKLAEDIKMVEAAGADILHIDVMDGHFVPNLTFGPAIIKKCKELTSLPLDVHLMITNAEETIDLYIDAGADYISVHQEAVTHLQRLLAYLRSKGVKAGVALNPATPVETMRWVATDMDFTLIMTVNPGFGSQKFIPQSLAKIAAAKSLFTEMGSRAKIQVDGGVGPVNAAKVIKAGASMLVAGSAIFNADNPAEAVNAMANANV